MIRENDLRGLQFLLDVHEELVAQGGYDDEKDHDENGQQLGYVLPAANFAELLHRGRIELLSELIRRTGAGLPLAEMVSKTGVEMKVQSKYYQGLTVRGKKCVLTLLPIALYSEGTTDP